MARTRQTYTNWNQLPLLLSIGEAAMLLRVSARTAQYYAQNNLIPASMVCGKYVVSRDKLREQIEGGEVA